MTIDRINPESAFEVIRTLIPRKSDQQVCLEFLASSIEVAHSISPNCWGVTLKDDLIRLNVGMIEVVSLSKVLHCILDYDTIPKNLWEDKIVNLFTNKDDPEFGFYKCVPNSVACNMSVQDTKNAIPLIRDSHQVLVESATQTTRNPSTKKAHSPAVIDYLSLFLGRRIPKPEY